MKSKNEFHNRKVSSIKNGQDKWISNLNGLQIQMSLFAVKDYISNEKLIIHVLNNLLEEYDVILDSLENHLILSEPEILTI